VGNEETGGQAIKVEVRVYAGLRRYLPEAPIGHSTTVMLRPGATVAEALESLGIPLRETKTCFVNGIQREPGHPLRDGDQLAAFPPIAGGLGVQNPLAG